MQSENAQEITFAQIERIAIAQELVTSANALLRLALLEALVAGVAIDELSATVGISKSTIAREAKGVAWPARSAQEAEQIFSAADIAHEYHSTAIQSLLADAGARRAGGQPADPR